MTIGVVQPDSGNIRSICDALDRLDRPWTLLRDPPDENGLAGLKQLLLPGQGRFGAVAAYLERHGWRSVLRRWVTDDRPLLGICVGMQVLFEDSEEDPGVSGLGLLRGRVMRLDSPKHPMIGWAPIDWKAPGYPAGAAYFVNSYAIRQHGDCLAEATYGETFCAAVARGNLIAFQFHPEKSGAFGKELLNQCLVC